MGLLSIVLWTFSVFLFFVMFVRCFLYFESKRNVKRQARGLPAHQTSLEHILFFPMGFILVLIILGYGFSAQIMVKTLLFLGLLSGFCVVNRIYQDKKRTLLSWVICFLSTLLIPPHLLLFEAIPAVLLYPILGTLFYLGARLLMALDQTNWLLLLTLIGQGIFLFFASLLQVIPPIVSFWGYLILVAVISEVILYVRQTQQVRLGEMSTTMISFCLAFVWTYLIAFGFELVPPLTILPQLSILGYATVIVLWKSHTLKSVKLMALFDVAYHLNIKRKHLIAYTLFVFSIASLLGVVLMVKGVQLAQSIFVVMFLIIFDMVVRLKKWGKPSVSYKEILADLKTGVSVLYQDMRHVPLKKEKEILETSKKPVPDRQKEIATKPKTRHIRQGKRK